MNEDTSCLHLFKTLNQSEKEILKKSNNKPNNFIVDWFLSVYIWKLLCIRASGY